MTNKTINGTSTLQSHDTYGHKTKISRVHALAAFVTGKVNIKWQVPTTKKRKGLYITGRKV